MLYGQLTCERGCTVGLSNIRSNRRLKKNSLKSEHTIQAGTVSAPVADWQPEGAL